MTEQRKAPAARTAAEEWDESCDGEEVTCLKCHGSGFFSDCFDDMCHGQDECIHGDDSTCSECDGEGYIVWKPEGSAATAAEPPLEAVEIPSIPDSKG